MRGRVSLQGVSKVFPQMGRRGRLNSLKGALLHGGLRPRLGDGGHVALDGVDLEVAGGEAVALIGPNGSGKSTLLKLMSGILRPSAGTVEVDGRVTALIELGAGFHPEITGRENVIINGMLLGLSRAEIAARLPEVVRFAGIGEFIDQPVKTYSSGMYVRLGFAVSVAVDPDVLLIDEVLAVGDESFTRRCLDRLAHMRRAGVSMVLVSHDLDLVRQLADRAYYLRRGRVVAEGPADAVVARYRSDVAGGEDEDGTPREVQVSDEGRRWGTGDVELLDVWVTSAGQRLRVVPSGADATVHLRYRVHRPVTDFVFGLAWHTADGAPVGGHNTQIDGLAPRRLEGDGEVRCHYPALHLAPGEYLLDAAVHASGGLAYDYRCRVTGLTLTAPAAWPGIWAPPHQWSAEDELWTSAE